MTVRSFFAAWFTGACVVLFWIMARDVATGAHYSLRDFIGYAVLVGIGAGSAHLWSQRS